jgi:murein DD-endopeptidase MepM/ murein hydrolase activator NlpD
MPGALREHWGRFVVPRKVSPESGSPANPAYSARSILALAVLLAAGCGHGARPAATPVPLSGDAAVLRQRNLRIPVAGVSAGDLRDSYDAPRADGRHHHAIDIPAPRGTPVLSADDGRVIRIHWNAAGGRTVYAVDRERRIVYYYAHLDRYRRGLRSGSAVAKGDTLGYVGTTGNAPKNEPHLHFQITRMPVDGRYWAGEAIDPFLVLGGIARSERSVLLRP